MNFEAYGLAVATPIVAAVVALAHLLDVLRQRRAISAAGNVETIALMANSLNRRRRVVRALLSLAALVLCLLALARPTVSGAASWRQRGIDVVFVHGFSTSMLAKDVYPSRLERSLKEGEVLMQGLAADRVGTVVYAGGAAHFPLTHDHVAARLLYQGLRPSDLAPGADLGQALRLASCLLRGDLVDPTLCGPSLSGAGGAPLQGEHSSLLAEAPIVSERARAVVLFSDGLDSAGFAKEEAARLDSLGIELFVVGVGTKSGELVPHLDSEGVQSGWSENDRGEFRTTQIDEELLREVAASTGTGYFGLGEGRWRGDELLAGLLELGRGDLDERVIRTRWHIFDRFLFPALLLLIMEACLSLRTRRVRLPVRGRAAP
ncbi:MAG: hypothetical protein GY811_24355 [Myxococcales bacterium]|nr:hypothetical protein [Myxococcales bacterium]